MLKPHGGGTRATSCQIGGSGFQESAPQVAGCPEVLVWAWVERIETRLANASTLEPLPDVSFCHPIRCVAVVNYGVWNLVPSISGQLRSFDQINVFMARHERTMTAQRHVKSDIVSKIARQMPCWRRKNIPPH